MATISVLSDVLEQLRTVPEPIHLASFQMGIVPYHLIRNFFGRVEVIDGRGIVDPQLTDCPTLEGQPRKSWGIEMGYRRFFRAIQECGIPSPEIVYDLESVEGGDRRSSVLREHGYSIVFLQKGEMSLEGSFAGIPIAADQFIAVRNDLVWLLDRRAEVELTLPRR